MTMPSPTAAVDAVQIVEAAAESLLVTTSDLDWPGPTIVYANAAFERMTGWSRTEVIGKTPRILQGADTDRSVFVDLRSRLLAGDTWENRTINYRKDGTPFVMEWSIVPLRNSAGQVHQYLAVQRDVTARIEAERARTNLSRYFSPQLVDLLAKRDDPVGPRRQNVAVLFVDIRGFTRIAETTSPDQLVALLRSFYIRMERLVFRHDGAIQGFMGDGIMATFGVPETSERDPVNALACAQGMLDEIARWNAERQASESIAVSVGIGVHYGPAVLGDIGDTRNITFTVVGDTVNIARRLEQLTRKVPCALVVSDDLVRAIRERAGGREAAALLASMRERGNQKVRGKAQSVRIWTHASDIR
jgi:PAS domain S-box-containing protein